MKNLWFSCTEGRTGFPNNSCVLLLIHHSAHFKKGISSSTVANITFAISVTACNSGGLSTYCCHFRYFHCKGSSSSKLQCSVFCGHAYACPVQTLSLATYGHWTRHLMNLYLKSSTLSHLILSYSMLYRLKSFPVALHCFTSQV